jgi:cytochrome P450/NADPH-cytochrome P450 reductase
MIMICAGAGLAPFRGFVQERSFQLAAGRKLAHAHLFIGCTDPSKDALFANEIKTWEKEGVVKVYYAYSRNRSLSKGCRYVQERVWAEREEMVKVFDDGAKVYICGSAMVDEGVAAVVKRIYMDRAQELGKPRTDEQVEEWFRDIRSDRYVTDVFS